jgi:adenylate cyclase
MSTVRKTACLRTLNGMTTLELIRTSRFRHLNDLTAVLECMTIAEHEARTADENVLDLGFRARELGASWRELADSVGISQQAANTRWGTVKSGRGREARRRRISHLANLRLGREQRRAQFEHERRFLVNDSSIIEGLDSFEIEQAYLWTDPGGYTIRIRKTRSSSPDGVLLEPPATLTLKGPRDGLGSRLKIDRTIPREDADLIISTAPDRVVRKRRYELPTEYGRPWEIDVFQNENQGLILAEFDGPRDVVNSVPMPEWCGREVTAESKYNNENLASKPWTSWNDDERGRRMISPLRRNEEGK